MMATRHDEYFVIDLNDFIHIVTQWIIVIILLSVTKST